MKRRRFAPRVKSMPEEIARASAGNMYLGPRHMFEKIVGHLDEAVRHDPRATPGPEPLTWDDMVEAGFVEDGVIGMFVRSEPVGKGWAVTMRPVRPSEVRSGAFYEQLKVYDRQHGIVADEPEPEGQLVAVNVLSLEKVGEMRRMASEYATASSGTLQPLDDVVVNGEVGVLVYVSPAPRGEERAEFVYVTPAEARRLLAGAC